jgi:transcriptional regulator with XRE-family HTH domain
MFDIGHAIYEKRLEKRMTQAELSKKAGIAQPNLSRIESGKRDITVSTLIHISRAMNINPADFFLNFDKESFRLKRFKFTRFFITKIVKAVLYGKVRLSAYEDQLVAWLRLMIPGILKRQAGKKKIYDAWFQLKRRLTNGEIGILIDRVREEQRRQRF